MNFPRTIQTGGRRLPPLIVQYLPEVLAIIVILAFYSAVLLPGMLISNIHDTFTYLFPRIFLAHNPLALWDPLWSGGFPLIASPMDDRMYIGSLPLYAFPAIPLEFFNIILLSHGIIAFFSMRSLLAHATRDWFPRTLFALIYTLSLGFVGRIDNGHIPIVYALAWIPLFFSLLYTLATARRVTVGKVLALTAVALILISTGGAYHVTFAFIFAACILISLLACREVSRAALIGLSVAGVATLFVALAKILPVLAVSDAIVRVDPIDPLAGGGFLETALSSFAFGTPIDAYYGYQESAILLSLTPVFLAVIALALGKRKFTLPVTLAAIFSVAFSAGGDTFLSPLHTLPFLESFRCPGRVLGVLAPLILLLAAIGYTRMRSALDRGDTISLTKREKITFLLMLTPFAALKVAEIPYQASMQYEGVIAIAAVIAFVAVLVSDRMTPRVVCMFLAGGIIITPIMYFSHYGNTFTSPLASIIKILTVCGALIALVHIAGKRMEKSGIEMNESHGNTSQKKADVRKKTLQKTYRGGRGSSRTLQILLAMSVVVVAIGSLASFQGHAIPFPASPADDLVASLPRTIAEDHGPAWSFETGWPFQHVDITYALLSSGISPMRAYLPYYLNASPLLAYPIGNTTYYTVDYIIDTAALETGEPTVTNESYTVGGMRVVAPDHVLPTVFVLRGNTLVRPNVTEYTPDRVTAEGEFLVNDVVVLKTGYYRGWMANGIPTTPVGNMVGAIVPVTSHTVTFIFQPDEFFNGFTCMGVGVIIIGILIVYRRKIDVFFQNCQ